MLSLSWFKQDLAGYLDANFYVKSGMASEERIENQYVKIKLELDGSEIEENMTTIEDNGAEKAPSYSGGDTFEQIAVKEEECDAEHFLDGDVSAADPLAVLGNNLNPRAGDGKLQSAARNPLGSLKTCKVRGRKRPSVRVKVEALNRLAKGAKLCTVAADFNVSPRSVCQWKRQKSLLESANSVPSSAARNRVQGNEHAHLLRERVYQWFCEERDKGVPLNQVRIAAKAIQLNKELGGPREFVASNGWINLFKKAYGIRQITNNGELWYTDNSLTPVTREGAGNIDTKEDRKPVFEDTEGDDSNDSEEGSKLVIDYTDEEDSSDSEEDSKLVIDFGEEVDDSDSREDNKVVSSYREEVDSHNSQESSKPAVKIKKSFENVCEEISHQEGAAILERAVLYLKQQSKKDALVKKLIRERDWSLQQSNR